MRKNRKSKKSFPRIAIPVILAAVILWANVVQQMTIVRANQFVAQLEQEVQTFVEYARPRPKEIENRYHELTVIPDYPGKEIMVMSKKLLSSAYDFHGPKWGDFLLGDWFDSFAIDGALSKEQRIGYRLGGGYFDLDNKPQMLSSNRLTYVYTDGEGWASGDSEPKAYGWVDLDKYSAFDLDALREFDEKWDNYVFRLRGWFEGNRFQPAVIEIPTLKPGVAVDGRTTLEGAYAETVRRADANGEVEWITVLQGVRNPYDEEQTIYAWNVERVHEDPVYVAEQSFGSMGHFLGEQAQFSSSGYHIGNFQEMVITNSKFGTDDNGFYRFSATVVCYPMQYVTVRMTSFYIASAIGTVLVVSLLLGWIWWHLIEPMQKVNAAMQDCLEKYGEAGEDSPSDAQRQLYHRLCGGAWEEPAAAGKNLLRLQQELAQRQAEIARLNTALDYAEDAEEYRKQLISNITHELKTPLAVIHSYTEGVQSDIAPEKKAHYVQVILDETERMDGMVMQMLELSRLEAGRVKLKINNFCLWELTEYVTEKFRPMLEAKNLNLAVQLPENLYLNADEARLEQVITNFVSNAVKYSPAGGEIQITGYCTTEKVHFAITNTAKHLSEEGLQKVFDSFYREDTARTEKSTGLGLSIVKGIVSLHSGECYVNNTVLNDKPAVEFGFNLPK